MVTNNAAAPYSVRKQLAEATLNEGLKAVRAGKIARMITENCEASDAQAITREQWDAEQNRLWKLAADDAIASDVMRILFPTLPNTSSAAATLGRRTSARKTAAARANGQKGGRPRKVAV